MTVEELNREQFEELKSDYYFQNYEEMEGYWTDVPDSVILEEYAGVIFSPDDFFCTAGQY